MTVKDNDPRDQIPHISPPPSQRELPKLGSQAANCLPYSLNPFKSATSHMSTRYSGYGF